MASIFFVETFAANTTVTTALEAGGDHTVVKSGPVSTGTSGATLESAWGSGHDVIYLDFTLTLAYSSVLSWVAAKWAAGVPLFIPSSGVAQQGSGELARYFNVGTTTPRYDPNPNTVNLIHGGSHPIVAGLSSPLTIMTADNFIYGLTTSYGTVVGTASYTGTGNGHDHLVAFEAGDALASGTAPARAAYFGLLGDLFYGQMTADGITLTGQIIDWLVAGASAATTVAIEATAPAPVVEFDITTAVYATINATAPLPEVEFTIDSGESDTVTVDIDVTAPLPVVEFTVVTHVVLPTDSLNLPAPTPVNVGVTLLPTPAPVPAGVTARTIELAAQPMPTLSADLTRVTDLDYAAPASVPYGRLVVFFDGVDVTHLRDVPCRIDSWSSARPSGDTAARVSFPQIAPWDAFGSGDLAPFRKDAPVEIGILRADESFDILWEGYWASEGDTTGEAREDTTLDCEGTFWQADHTIHIPALHLEPTDIGILIPRALNAVPGRRYAAIPEVVTGILSRERGSQTQSVLAYVQDLLSTAWTEDGRQWTLARVAPYTYRLQLADITTVHGTITKGAWGVEIDLARDESTRVDAVYCRGVAPSGGVWANWFWPGLDLYTPPPYLYASPATNMTPGATDAGTLTGSGVSDWQRRVVEMGYNLTVTGVHDAASVAAARWVQQQRGILVDGVVGPQTWNATWDVGAQALDLTAIRLPLAWKPETERYLYTANGAVAGDNPAYNAGLVRRSVDLNFGADVTKSTARPLAQRYLDMYGEAAWTGRVTLSTDTHEGISRLEYREGMNLRILGHDGAPLLVQIADAEHGELSSTFTVDERARDAMAVDAILARDRDARRMPAARPGNPTKLAQLDRNQIVQYEDESKAGVVPRLAINGSAGLWTVVPIFVSQTGSVAKMTFQTSSPATTYCVAIYGRPITANQQAAFVPNPLTNGDGWRDHEMTLLTRFGWIDAWGEPNQRAGYSPWQETDGRGVTGKLTDDAGFPFVSESGGYLWVAIYAAVDCFIEGRLFPGVPQ